MGQEREHDLTDDCWCVPTSQPVKRDDGSIGWVVVHKGWDAVDPTYATAETDSLLFQLPCSVCEQPMRFLGRKVRWNGDWEVDAVRFECTHACQTSATVEYRTFIPQGIVGEREAR